MSTLAKREVTVEEVKERPCLLCDRMCAVVREQGGLLLKAPCSNSCADGYAREHES